MKSNFIKLVVMAGVTFTLLFGYVNCAPQHEGAGNSSSQGGGPGPDPDSKDLFASTVHPVVRNHCRQCHGTSQFPLFAVADPDSAYNTIDSFGTQLVNLSDPANSKLVKKIDGNHPVGSPVDVSVSTEIQDAIESWASQL
jgi:hypothetical protein